MTVAKVDLPPDVARAFVKDMRAFVANASGVWDRLLPLQRRAARRWIAKELGSQ